MSTVSETSEIAFNTSTFKLEEPQKNKRNRKGLRKYLKTL